MFLYDAIPMTASQIGDMICKLRVDVVNDLRSGQLGREKHRYRAVRYRGVVAYVILIIPGPGNHEW